MKLAILGTRGIPAQHGGFETFAEKLALYLISQGWDVSVYCQVNDGLTRTEDWRGIRLVKIPTPGEGAFATIRFDLHSTLHAMQEDSIKLILGYNTAIFSILYRIKGLANLINMDGLEWQRKKWGPLEKAWLFLNERAAGLLADHLIADHPEICAHLTRFVPEEKVTTIPYGAEETRQADMAILGSLGLQAHQYAIVIARPEPENSILEIVQGFSQQPRGMKLVVLGRFDASNNRYHQQVIANASNEVLFPGAIYEPQAISALRHFARIYVHGHTVGGTNPSLVEALATGMAVLAHDNQFNRWVAGPNAAYFKENIAAQFDELLIDDQRLEAMRAASREQYHALFTLELVNKAYENLLRRWG